MKFNISITLLIFAWLSLACSANCKADTLTELLRSPTKQEFDEQSGKFRSKTRDKDYWVDPDSNYGSLFSNYKSPEKLIHWISDSAIGYVRFELKAKKFPEYIQGSAQFTLRGSNQPFFLEILVPHPRYSTSARFNLIEAFADREPPKLQVQSSKSVKVRGKDAQFFQVDPKKCSVLIKAPRHSLVVATNDHCDKPNDLIYFVNSLDVGRLFKNLDS